MDNFEYECLKDRVFHRKKIGADCSELERVALEYRRANNIFEVGDKVIRLDVDNIFIYTVQKVTLDLITVVRKKKPNAVKTWGMWLGNNDLRHATDAERQAGKRLPQLEVLNDIDIPPNTIILGDK